MDEITRILIELRDLEERFRKTIKNPALQVSENGGFTVEEYEKLKKLIGLIGEANIAGNEILKKHS